ncbi:MAG TPA: M48 family metallopeptidase [Propioniciclava sp.]|uniref:M48 family metallopeptidase n=1 Tax=Propioniciclava sp. TaxID=2038686 RepID=UPI002CC734B7|nr:M48 family metallopeptidase [Propioniciclava sp.]HRL48951.1 M48 family metallopeptidase [Propioniciclava sp.]
MQKLRAGLELVVVLIFPIVVLAVLLGVVLAVVLAASVHGALGRIVAQLLFIPVVVGVIAAVRQALRARMEPTAGPALTREADPELWAVVDDLAQQAATATPDRIVLVSDANAEVLQAAGRRELLIGLPVFAALTVGELRAVLAHEMGHFAGGEAAANVRTLRARTFVKTMRDNSSILIRWFFSLYYRVAVWCTAATSRDLERRADGYSARAAGPQAAADAARAMTATSLVWDVVVEERVSLFEDAGRRAPLSEAVRHTLDAKAEDVGRAVTELLAEERPRWDSTHPRTADRIAAFEAMPASDVPRDDRPALALIGGPGVRLHRLEGELLRAAWPLATWDEVVAASLPALGDRSDRLLLALHEDGALPEPPSRRCSSPSRTNPRRWGCTWSILATRHPPAKPRTRPWRSSPKERCRGCPDPASSWTRRRTSPWWTRMGAPTRSANSPRTRSGLVTCSWRPACRWIAP